MKGCKFFSAIVLVFISTLGFTQGDIPIGTWRTHFSFNQVNHIANAEDVVFAAGKNGIFIFDKSDNSISKVTALDGLQKGTVSALAYKQDINTLFLGYESGNIDLVDYNDGRTIQNFDFSSNTQIQGSRKVNHFNFVEDVAFISTDYGVLKFDLNKREVKETYRQLGLDADSIPQELKVSQSTIYNDSLFIATAQGVLAANITQNINLVDYRSWRRYNMSDSIPAVEISVIATVNNKVIAGIDDNGLYSYGNGTWKEEGILVNTDFKSFKIQNEPIIVTAGEVYRLQDDLSPTLITIPEYSNSEFTEALLDGEGSLWVGSLNRGLVSNFTGSFDSYLPSGPSSNDVFRLQYIDGQIYAVAGGFSVGVATGRAGEFYTFSDATWSSFGEEQEENKIPEFNDIVDVARVNSKIYLASFGYGLLEINQNDFQVFDETNSPLINTNPPDRNVKISAIESINNSLWVLNYGSNQVHQLSADSQWQSYSIPTSVASFAIDFIIVNSALWLIIDQDNGGGILVFDPDTGDTRYLTSNINSGGLPSDIVNSLTIDKEGLVWVGTDVGVSVFTNTSGVFNGSVDAVEPIFENRQLLRDEEITDIEIDGGNRKWIGTNRGVWLFDEQADNQLRFFNIDNSPLPSNQIIDIEIEPTTGEVFFATPQGMVSWRSTATESGDEHTNVEIFPNPVRENFNGTVGISGLASDVDVRITDVSGKLIWKTKANGGTATWRVRDYNGNRAATGVYLVFSSSEDGEETFVGKIAVIK
ncbi:T9SS type A sorting domain-containing protein [Fulvivirga sp. RKSG066]|uniref:type IX secretion system anionic LPS delivery protein PorZ n=1 Tax=Fulvivirga aurantia TaxID=2529383 RepID=UPI0012BCDC14|nr:T9SS type A sorting domain-containing protein [Fulvivirga aurantia]MTI20142.1 T9SS type A sorting domain-containing protein [Fulvivirga aurantia]